LEGSADFGAGIALSDKYIAIGAVREDAYSDSGDYLGGTGGVYIYDLQRSKPKILNIPSVITYSEGRDYSQLYTFEVSEPVTYIIGGVYSKDFIIDPISNELKATHRLEYNSENENNNSYPININISNESGKTNTYHTVITVTPIQFHSLEYKKVVSPFTGRVWIDRNIGAKEICDTHKSNMSGCYGDYFQWGRGIDGHEKGDSNTTKNYITNFNNVNNLFVTNTVDWSGEGTSGIDNNGSIREKEWSKIDGSSVCPIGFRVPTLDELKAEIDNITDVQNSFLKFPYNGNRYNNGEFQDVGLYGYLWTSTPTDTDTGQSHYTSYNTSKGFNTNFGGDRADGMGVSWRWFLAPLSFNCHRQCWY